MVETDRREREAVIEETLLQWEVADSKVGKGVRLHYN